jgi:hypothetical protein
MYYGCRGIRRSVPEQEPFRQGEFKNRIPVRGKRHPSGNFDQVVFWDASSSSATRATSETVVCSIKIKEKGVDKE